MIVQLVLAGISLVVLLGITVLMYSKRKYQRKDVHREDRLTIDSLVEKSKRGIVDMMNDSEVYGASGEEFDSLYKRQQRIKKARNDCVYGIPKAKVLMKSLIAGIIQDILPDDDSVDTVIDLNGKFIDRMIKFEILAHFLCQRKDIGKNLIDYLFTKYKVDTVKYDIEDGTVPHYKWSNEELDHIYSEEINFTITYLDKLKILATLVYQKLTGLGCIDTVMDLAIDGLNMGASGSVLADTLNRGPEVPRYTRSLWLLYHGKYIHAEFFDFKTGNEMRRIVQLATRYNSPGALTEKKAAQVATRYNQSRVLAWRPPVAECWAMFVRNFDLGDMTLLKLLDPPKKDRDTGDICKDEEGNVIHLYKNAKMLYYLIRFLMEGQVSTGFTGRQSAGKTTLMKYAFKGMDARLTVRVLELSFEMYLREIYPHRNMAAVQETQWESAASLQDYMKKSDAAISIIGEVATDIVAARMLQMGQVSSIFIVFSHHAVTARDLVLAITNSVVAASGGSATPDTVLPQVLDVIKVDVHLNFDVDGNRYVERVTEIRKVQDDTTFMPIDKSDIEYCRAYNERVYYIKQTERSTFKTVDILHFDKETFTYVADEFMSRELTEHICQRLSEEREAEFVEFALKYWDRKDGDEAC